MEPEHVHSAERRVNRGKDGIAGIVKRFPIDRQAGGNARRRRQRSLKLQTRYAR